MDVEAELESHAQQLEELEEHYPEENVRHHFEKIINHPLLNPRGLPPIIIFRYALMILRFKLAEKWGYRLGHDNLR